MAGVIAKKGPRYTQNIDLVSEGKNGFVEFSVFDFGKFDFEYMSYVLTYGCELKYMCYMYDYNYG